MKKTKRAEIKGTIVSNDDKKIYEWFDIQATCPNDIAKAMKEAAGDDITIEINSPGGLVSAGDEMYYIMNQYNGKVIVDIAGYCCSAATLASCGADKVRAIPSAIYMIHNVSTQAAGDYKIMDKTSDVLKINNEAIAAVYEAKTKMSREELLKLMDKESFMTAQQAKEYGFIDEIIEPKTVYNNMAAVILSEETKEKVRNMIEKMKIAGQKETEEKNNDARTAILKARLHIQDLEGEAKK